MSDYKYSRFASQTHYLPANPDNWAVPPVDVKDALDKLAASASGLAWQNPVEDKDIADPTPLTPSTGDRYIVAVGGAAAWTGKDNDIAQWDGTQWDFDTPTEGFACEVLDEDQYYAFTGTAWIILPDFLGAVSGTPPSIDKTIPRLVGITGLKIQNSPHVAADNGDIENTGTSATTKTSDKTAAANSVGATRETGDVSGVGATGASGDIVDESGATVDGNSGSLKRIVGTPTGTGTRGNIEDSATIFEMTLGNKNGTTYFGTLDVDGDFLFRSADSALSVFSGTTANPSCTVILTAKDAASNAAIALYSSNITFKEAEFVYNQALNTVLMVSAERSDAVATKDVVVGSGPQTNAGDFDSGSFTAKSGQTVTAGDSGQAALESGNAADDSGDAIVKTGTAGSVRGNVKLDGLSIELTGGQIIKRTAVADANHAVIEGQYLIAYTSITVTRTVTLPDPSTIPVNTVFKINDESGSVTPLIKITLTPAVGNLDGVASLDITNAYGTVEIYSNGTNYFTC